MAWQTWAGLASGANVGLRRRWAHSGHFEKAEARGYIKAYEFAPTQMDEFLLLDMRGPHYYWLAINLARGFLTGGSTGSL